jgi:hypothetical protein
MQVKIGKHIKEINLDIIKIGIPWIKQHNLEID